MLISESKTKWRLRQDIDLITGSKRERTSVISKLLGNFQKVAIFGGAIRDLALGKNVNQTADIDVVVEADEFQPSKIFKNIQYVRNKFGGIRLKYHNRLYDIWALNQTWAFKEGHVKLSKFEDIIRTTFFSIDASCYFLPNHELCVHEKYFDHLREKILDINFEPNPNPSGMAKKALHLALYSGFSLTPRVADFVLKHMPKSLPSDFETSLKKILCCHMDRFTESNFNFSRNHINKVCNQAMFDSASLNLRVARFNDFHELSAYSHSG